MKVLVTENQYKNLVEQFSMDDLTKKAKKIVKDVQEVVPDINWRKVDRLALDKLNKSNMGWAIKSFEGLFGRGSSSPDILPLPTIKMGVNSPYSGDRWGRKHHGVDLDTTGDVRNQPAVATCNGTVKVSEYGGGACGGTVVIGCKNGVDVQYCHMDFVLPENSIVGKVVPQGFPIGVTGGENAEYSRSGRSGGAHLHYAFWQPYMKKSLNPHKLYPNLFPSKTGSQGPESMTV